jgi:ferredoxin
MLRETGSRPRLGAWEGMWREADGRPWQGAWEGIGSNGRWREVIHKLASWIGYWASNCHWTVYCNFKPGMSSSMLQVKMPEWTVLQERYPWLNYLLLPLGVFGSHSGKYELQGRYGRLGYFLLLLRVLGSQSGKYAGKKELIFLTRNTWQWPASRNSQRVSWKVILLSSHHACNRALADMPVSKLEAKWWAEWWSSGLDSRLNVWCKPKGELKGDPMGWTSCMQQSTCRHACHLAASWKVSLKVIQWAWQQCDQALMVWGGQQHTSASCKLTELKGDPIGLTAVWPGLDGLRGSTAHIQQAASWQSWKGIQFAWQQCDQAVLVWGALVTAWFQNMLNSLTTGDKKLK